MEESRIRVRAIDGDWSAGQCLARERDDTMKRTGSLYERLTSWTNLLLAAKRARRHKRFRPDVAQFEYDVEHELVDLQRELQNHTYQPGEFRSFEVFDPKHRLVSAAPYRDRVVHHAICNVIEPLFERGFSDDTYACRVGKGTHRALRRARYFSGRFSYALKTDIARFFPSIDHQLLLNRVRHKIKDCNVISLIDRVVAKPFPGQTRCGFFRGDDLFTSLERYCGLPIGNQTSQLFANVMLDPIDHWIKEVLRCPGYIRYMDDIVLFSNSPVVLRQWRDELSKALLEMRLRLSARKTNLIPTRCGFRFLGFRVLPGRLLVPKPSLTRTRRRLRIMEQQYQDERIKPEEIRHRIASWWGHIKVANGLQLYRHILSDFPFVQQALERLDEQKAASRRRRTR